MLDAAQVALAIASVLSPCPPPMTVDTIPHFSSIPSSPVKQLTAAIDRFERAMFERSHESANESQSNLELILSEDGAGRMAAMMMEMMSMVAAGAATSAEAAEARIDMHK